MEYRICFAAALVLFLSGCAAAVLSKNGRGLKKSSPVNCLIIGVFLSSVMLFVPIYARMFNGDEGGWIKTILLSIHNSIRLFIVDGEFNIIDDNITGNLGPIWMPYSVLAAVLFVFAPILTFSVILSLIKNVWASAAYRFSYFRNVYAFSQWNERAVSLAMSIRKSHPRSVFVFTNAAGKENLRRRGKELRGIFFRKDIGDIPFHKHSPAKRITFMIIGEEEQNNVRKAIELIDRFKTRPNTELYVFSSALEGELLLADIDKGKMKVRRINTSRALIDHFLYEYGEVFFDEARSPEQSEENLEKAQPDPAVSFASNAAPAEDEESNSAALREINILLLGIGTYGRELLKALPWFCQMDGYFPYISAYDQRDDVLETIWAECPELLDDKHNGNENTEDAVYRIEIHPGYAVNTERFRQSLMQEGRKATFCFISLGSDEENVKAAVNVRMLFERMGIRPRIVTVVHDSKANNGLQHIRNFKGQPYGIQFIGADADIYSERICMNSELEEEALKRHRKWGDEESFWKYEYNYRSSIATTIHGKMKAHCHIPGVEKRTEELTKSEKIALEKLEHRRWNAYMRGSGYVYSGSPDPASRNDLGKMHHNLVPYSFLSEQDKEKDSQVTTK